jgi:hypothetical protein
MVIVIVITIIIIIIIIIIITIIIIVLAIITYTSSIRAGDQGHEGPPHTPTQTCHLITEAAHQCSSQLSSVCMGFKCGFNVIVMSFVVVLALHIYIRYECCRID